MSYIFSRLRSTALHLLSLRGLLIALGVATAIVSILSSGTVSQVAGVAGVGLLSTLVTLISLRQTDHHTLISRLQRNHKKLAKQGQRMIRAGSSGPLIGLSDSALHVERLSQARAAILQVRGTIATGVTPTPTVQPAETTGEISGVAPAVTVVVPLYNEARFVGATLESLRRQTFDDWECIVVDDASTDNSVVAARRYTKIDGRFRLVRHKVNGGLSAARNTGLRLGRGRYITFLDSDDILMADSLIDRLETIAGADIDIAGAFCGVRQTPEDVALDSLQDHEDWPNQRFVDFVSSNAECPFNAHAPLLLTSVVRSAGGFDESMRDGAEDWDLWLRIMRKGYGFIPSRWITAVYRQKRHSMAKAGAESHVGEAQQLIARAYEPSDRSLSDTAGVHAFPLALPDYQKQLVLARRAIQYAATSVARGDTAAAKAILSDPATVVEPWMERHFSFDAVIQAGFRRAFGLGPREADELAPDLEPLGEWVRSLIASQPDRGGPQNDKDMAPGFDTLFIPQNAAQADAMVRATQTVPEDHSVAFLNIERVAGAAGVADVVAGTSYPQYSLNEWILNGLRHVQTVVSFPRDAAIEEILTVLEPTGGLVVDLRLPGDEVMTLDDRPDYGRQITTVDASGLAARLSSIGPTYPTVSLGDATGRFGPWTGLTDPTPDESWVIEEYPDTFFDPDAIARFKNMHKGERCVIIGNGPSLNEVDLRKLKDEYTIGVNGIFYAAERMGFDLSYYLVEDTAVMADNVEAIRNYKAGHKFFPSIYRNQIGEAPNVTYFMMNRGFYAPSSPAYCIPRFSTDPTQRMYSGQSVTIINLQVAYYMGFSEVVLIGMDFSYTVPSDAKVEGALITSMGDDPNHFHPDYFGKGKVWKDPKLDRVLANYQLAKLMYEADGRRIVNATPGGKLELFDRVPYEDLFG